MKRSTIFENKTEMPSQHNADDEVVRTALTMPDAQMHNLVRALSPSDNGTRNLPPPKRGHRY